MSNRNKARLAALAGNGIFGFSFLFSKIGQTVVSPIVLLAGRFFFAALVMTFLVLIKVFPVSLKGKKIYKLLILGLLQPVLYFLCENYGIKYSSSSMAGVLISLIPVVAFLMGTIFLKEKFKTSQFLWVILSVAGVAVISLSGQGENGLTPIGLALLLGAVVIGAAFNTLSRSISAEFTPIERTYIMFLVGTVVFTAMAMISTHGAAISELAVGLLQPKLAFSLIFLSILSSIVAFGLLNYCVTYLPVKESTSFASITSVISVVAGAVVLKESISLIQLAAIVVILVSVYMVNREA